MPLNITSSMTPEEILAAAHKYTAIPSLWIGFIIGYLITLIIGMISYDTSKGRFKFFVVWIISLVIVGVIYLFLSSSPNFVQSFSNLWNNLWS